MTALRADYGDVNLENDTNIRYIGEKILERIEVNQFNQEKNVYLPPAEMDELNLYVHTLVSSVLRKASNPQRQDMKLLDEIKELEQIKEALNNNIGQCKRAEKFLLKKAYEAEKNSIEAKSKKLGQKISLMEGNKKPLSMLREKQKEEKRISKRKLDTKLRRIEKKLIQK